MAVVQSAQIAQMLLEIGAITLNTQNPYLYSSGLKGPIYCDNRLILSYPKARTLVAQALLEQFKALNLDSDAIAGIATGGIAYATLLAQATNLPMLYIRSSSKSHGKQKCVEGSHNQGDKLLLIEDLITTAGSAMAAATTARESGAVISDCFSIFTYQLETANLALEAHKVRLHPLCTLDTLLEVALQTSRIDQRACDSIKAWREKPDQWRADSKGVN